MDNNSIENILSITYPAQDFHVNGKFYTSPYNYALKKNRHLIPNLISEIKTQDSDFMAVAIIYFILDILMPLIIFTRDPLQSMENSSVLRNEGYFDELLRMNITDNIETIMDYFRTLSFVPPKNRKNKYFFALNWTCMYLISNYNLILDYFPYSKVENVFSILRYPNIKLSYNTSDLNKIIILTHLIKKLLDYDKLIISLPFHDDLFLFSEIFKREKQNLPFENAVILDRVMNFDIPSEITYTATIMVDFVFNCFYNYIYKSTSFLSKIFDDEKKLNFLNFKLENALFPSEHFSLQKNIVDDADIYIQSLEKIWDIRRSKNACQITTLIRSGNVDVVDIEPYKKLTDYQNMLITTLQGLDGFNTLKSIVNKFTEKKITIKAPEKISFYTPSLVIKSNFPFITYIKEFIQTTENISSFELIEKYIYNHILDDYVYGLINKFHPNSLADQYKGNFSQIEKKLILFYNSPILLKTYKNFLLTINKDALDSDNPTIKGWLQAQEQDYNTFVKFYPTNIGSEWRDNDYLDFLNIDPSFDVKIPCYSQLKYKWKSTNPVLFSRSLVRKKYCFTKSDSSSLFKKAFLSIYTSFRATILPQEDKENLVVLYWLTQLINLRDQNQSVKKWEKIFFELLKVFIWILNNYSLQDGENRIIYVFLGICIFFLESTDMVKKKDCIKNLLFTKVQQKPIIEKIILFYSKKFEGLKMGEALTFTRTFIALPYSPIISTFSLNNYPDYFIELARGKIPKLFNTEVMNALIPEIKNPENFYSQALSYLSFLSGTKYFYIKLIKLSKMYKKFYTLTIEKDQLFSRYIKNGVSAILNIHNNPSSLLLEISNNTIPPKLISLEKRGEILMKISLFLHSQYLGEFMKQDKITLVSPFFYNILNSPVMFNFYLLIQSLLDNNNHTIIVPYLFYLLVFLIIEKKQDDKETRRFANLYYQLLKYRNNTLNFGDIVKLTENIRYNNIIPEIIEPMIEKIQIRKTYEDKFFENEILKNDGLFYINTENLYGDYLDELSEKENYLILENFFNNLTIDRPLPPHSVKLASRLEQYPLNVNAKKIFEFKAEPNLVSPTEISPASEVNNDEPVFDTNDSLSADF